MWAYESGVFALLLGLETSDWQGLRRALQASENMAGYAVAPRLPIPSLEAPEPATRVVR
jgi:hypothetical protein